MSADGADITLLASDSTTILTTSKQLTEITPDIPKQQDISHSDINGERGGGEALEWAQVIELQAFSERKAWIEEKTRFLEQLPPIEVFAALDSLRSGSEEISSGLPTREELRKWVAEHDRIEKETEIFDAGEFRKLKKFTKAAAQRNLSPADTDLIELTLTTIYDLDKLLHLLRDRSEHLDLLGVRLTWEEHRCAAWVDYHKVIDDLRAFLTNRAHWSPAIYESLIQERSSSEDKPLRRGSIASITSIASDSSASPAGLSRGARFKFTEILSKDAAQISTRISALRRSKISPAGKALDKLIDDSRKPVPDVLLDEQDRLENKGITEMEDVGQFVMSVVMQWKKADEIYVENQKDQAAAQALIEEIEVAKSWHPQARQDAVFMSRANALTNRLAQRGDPGSVTNTFLRPVHPLFTDQENSNAVIINILSSEMASSMDLVKRAELLAREYHASFEAVNRAESLCTSAEEHLAHFDSLTHRLEKGVEAKDGDGTPPNLDDINCLEPTSHSTFLALFPSLLGELDELNTHVDKISREFTSALLRLDRPGIDYGLKARAVFVAEELSSRRRAVQRIRDETTLRVNQLRHVRKIRSSMDNIVGTLKELHQDIEDGIKREKWTPPNPDLSSPLTPESSMDTLPPSSITPADALRELDVLQSVEAEEISSSYSSIAPTLPVNLRGWVMQDFAELRKMIESLKQMSHLWEAIRTQSSIMNIVVDEATDLRVRLEDLKSNLDDRIDAIFEMHHSQNEITPSQEHLPTDEKELRESTQVFIDGLSRRVPFISNDAAVHRSSSGHVRKRSSLSSNVFSTTTSRQRYQLDPPVDPVALDNNVRTNCNQLSMALSGAIRSLQAKTNHLQLARLSKVAETSLCSLNDSITRIADDVNAQEASFNAQKPSDLIELRNIAERLNDRLRTSRTGINRSLSHIRGLIVEMENTPDNHDGGVYERMVSPRNRELKEAETQFYVLEENVSRFKHGIAEAQRVESGRLAEVEAEKREQERRDEEERVRREEMERQEKEEMDRREQEEREKIEAAELKRLEKDEMERQTRQKEAEERERRDKQIRERLQQEESERKEREERECKAKEKEKREHTELQKQQEARTRRESGADIKEKSKNAQFDEVAKKTPSMHDEKNDVDQDVFGFHLASAAEIFVKDHETVDLQSRIFRLRRRLRSLNINEIVRPSSSTGSLPTNETRDRIVSDLSIITNQVSKLPFTVADPSVNMELDCLRAELSSSSAMLDKLYTLADFSHAVRLCDASFSDFIEHVDSYPSLPVGPLTSTHVSDRLLPPKQQLSARLAYTQRSVDDVVKRAANLTNDRRIIDEQERIVQTWSELEAMGTDLLNDQKSPSYNIGGSAASSGRSSRASLDTNRRGTKKSESYSKLSASRMSTSGFLLPPNPNSRRIVSGSSTEARERSTSRLSVSSRISSNRSVSGPGPVTSSHPSSSLYNSTFSSRQRKTSVSLGTSPVGGDVLPATSRHRAQTGHRASPTPSETSFLSRSMMSTSTGSTWSRALRQSLPPSSRPSTPRRSKAKQPRKPYVADPKNKLDMAIGDVVNKLPININVEVVADTWKDKSGKYWIGDQDPKLCFCRILRSQTVMVRVGGGWQELSKFINVHFADLYRLFPADSPSRDIREEKWISAASLRASENSDGFSPSPRTPEQSGGFLPAIALSTPNGRSPQSIKSTPSNGSPLTPLQFLRRADLDSFQRPETPLKASSSRSRGINSGKLHHPAWRP